MTQTPEAGWYPDPAAPAGTPGALRWWDGTRWTEHETPGAAGTPAADGAYPGAKSSTTPDGQPLAGLGARFGAYVLDSLISLTITLILGLPFVSSLLSGFDAYVRRSLDAARLGQPGPNPLSVYADNAGALLGYLAVALLVSLCYNVGFLRWRSATPGKLALGLRVRLRDSPGPLSWGTALKRWAGQFPPAAVVGVYGLIDLLWPLWDDKRQTLHDKFAATNVVTRR